MKPLVAIVGRPNVGKSTLFNRLARRRAAIVEDEPGVTRDRQYADMEVGDREVTVIDTGGFVPGDKDALLVQVREQAQLAVEESDVILLVVDAREGLTGADLELGTYLRRSAKRVLVVANKLDTEAPLLQALSADFFRLGFDEVLPVSAAHGLGMVGLLEAVLERLPPAEAPAAEEPAGEQPIRIAIIGRPNVGKSTLVNALLGQKRLVANPLPGTTRDPIDSELSYGERRIVLTDTAGIRRKKTIAHRLEKFAVVAALRALERSDVAALLLDATEPAVDQDAKLAGIVEERGRALVIVVNKWDLLEKDARRQDTFREWLKDNLKFVSYAPVVFTSALTGQKVERVLESCVRLHEQFHFRAPTPQLNRLLKHVTEEHPAPVVSGKPLRLYYVAQVGVAPPTFAFTCNRPQLVPGPYKRYLMNQLRATFNLLVPLRLLFRPRPGQAKRAARRRPTKERKERTPRKERKEH